MITKYIRNHLLGITNVHPNSCLDISVWTNQLTNIAMQKAGLLVWSKNMYN